MQKSTIKKQNEFLNSDNSENSKESNSPKTQEPFIVSKRVFNNIVNFSNVVLVYKLQTLNNSLVHVILN